MPCERCCPFTAAEDMRTPCLVDGPLRITRETLAPAAAGGDCQEAACNEAATYRLKGQGALDTNQDKARLRSMAELRPGFMSGTPDELLVAVLKEFLECRVFGE